MVTVGLIASGCAVPGLTPQATISGQISGQSVGAAEQGRTLTTGLAATLTCNGVTTRASQTGAFSLSLAQAAQYHCVASAPPDYVPSTALIRDPHATEIVLAFDGAAAQGTGCATPASGSNTITCGPLALQSGTVAGTLSGSDGSPYSGAGTVNCEDAATAARQDAAAAYGQPNWTSTLLRAQGAYALHDLAAGPYNCVAQSETGASALRTVVVAPAVRTRLDFTICTVECPPVHYHLGPVMHDYSAYLIFWLPPGHVLDPSGNAAFIATIRQYFADVGGTPFMGMLSQYYDDQGPLTESSRLGGVYVDTTPYEHCPVVSVPHCSPAAATAGDPLVYTDIQAEVLRAMAAEHWTPGTSHEFFVFLADGAQECESGAGSGGPQCTFLPTGQRGYVICAFHNEFPAANSAPIIYGLISDTNTQPDACIGSLVNVAPQPPHGNWALDAEIANISHEQLESITDPVQDGPVTGWYDDSPQHAGEEIADLCQDSFPHVGPDGANVTLRDGARFLVQAEWSNAAGGCFLP